MSYRKTYAESMKRFEDAGRSGLAGDIAEAERLYREEPEDSELRGVALAQLAQLLGRTSRWTEAEEIARAAIEDFATYGEVHGASCVLAHRVLGERAGDRRSVEEAAGHFNRACDLADRLMAEASARRDGGGSAAEENREIQELLVEKANVLNSHGGALLLAHEPADAIPILKAARDCQKKAGHSSNEGVAEVLTHLALAYRQIGVLHLAHLCLREAIDIAKSNGDGHQLFRAYVELHCLDPTATDLPKEPTWVEDAARQAEDEGQHHVAFVRWCMAVERSLEAGQWERARAAATRAQAIESSLPDDHLERAALRRNLAQLYAGEGDEENELAALLDGAERWHRVIGNGKTLKDVERITRLMHEHFRLLTGAMLRRGRTDEALSAFEYGRSLAHALEAFPELLDHLGRPTASRTTLSTAVVSAAREQLGTPDVVIVFAMLPALLAAFVVGKDGVQVVTQEVSGMSSLADELDHLPAMLQEGKGRDAVPNVVIDLAAQTLRAVGDARVVGAFPHALLHAVPWRVLFNTLGAPFRQLPMPIGFGLALWAFRRLGRPTPTTATALGFGVAGAKSEINFQDEAIEFAAKWGEPVELLEASGENVAKALRREQLVYVSSHGHQKDGAITLALSDGPVTIFDLLSTSRVASPIVLLSACYSATYFVRFGDHPFGPAPELLRRGARLCVGSRWPIRVSFTSDLFPQMAPGLRAGEPVEEVFTSCLEQLAAKHDLWKDLACIEMLVA